MLLFELAIIGVKALGFAVVTIISIYIIGKLSDMVFNFLDYLFEG